MDPEDLQGAVSRSKPVFGAEQKKPREGKGRKRKNRGAGFQEDDKLAPGSTPGGRFPKASEDSVDARLLKHR